MAVIYLEECSTHRNHELLHSKFLTLDRLDRDDLCRVDKCVP